jgi:Sodium/hydrogen exchanger family
MNALELTLLYLLAAVLGVVVCRMLKLPAMLGYLAVGVIIGPNALALAQNSTSIRYLAEFGVVFLMFVIGLEFNLPKLRSMRQHVFGFAAGRGDHALRDSGRAVDGLDISEVLANELAKRTGTERRASDEQHGDCGQVDARALGTGE